MTDQLAKAYQAGVYAREAGRGIASCPMYATGDPGRIWRDAWVKGWTDGKEDRHAE